MQRTPNDVHLLGSLISVKGQTATGTLHDDARAEATQDTSLVVLRWVQLGDDRIIWIGQTRVAGWARSLHGASVEAGLNFGTLQAE